ncbi:MULTISPECIES: methionine--tRNA ligase [Kocuria]|uniref:methionine--tRNA ligase n=1 Tax=Kocuria TaxID=57493 RepID=UPI00201D38FA|nr:MULTISPECIES: methionine--tRNA ligase [Kocuria]MCT1590606.1 methionine--tRNA ligase [Kocuria palustris]
MVRVTSEQTADVSAETPEPETVTSARPAFYLTTAISYPNGAPHIGHAYEAIAADVLARFKRLDGYDVRFLTGTDEHGQKMQQTADREGIAPKQLADRNAAAFRSMDDMLQVSYDRFIRTTDADHYEASQEIWRRMEANGDIYLDSYSGWYSVRDEAYYAEDETEVVDGVRLSKGTGTELTWTEESSYFFRLSAYQDRLLALYEDGLVGPQSRSNEVAEFVRGGLRDLSISRTTFDWGVPVPGDPDHVMYVWVDALTNYLTGVGYPDVDGELFQKFWPADVHIIGKDIIRFHSVYWPAFLMSAGLPVPRKVFGHGFLFNQGEKMSKSVGNVIDPQSLVSAYGLDALRFFLMREVPFGQDGSYSHEAIVSRIDSDLSNDLGNLAQRSLSMVAKNLEGRAPQPGELTAEDRQILDDAHALLPQVREAFDALQFHRGLEQIWKVVAQCNRYFSSQEPWVLRKTNPERMATVLWSTLEVVRTVAVLVQPVMPGSAARLLDALGQEAQDREFTALSRELVPGTPLPKPTPVFPRYEEPSKD